MSTLDVRPEQNPLADEPANPDPSSGASPAAAQPSSNWAPLVERIQAGDETGLEELYGIFSKGIRFFLCRRLGPQELEDKVHDTFLIVVHAIQNGELRDPERLMGFVRTIVRRQIASYIDTAVQTRREQADIDSGIILVDRRANPEKDAIGREKTALMRRVLNDMSTRDREILTRFYLREESQEKICREMNLTDTQFRLLKSRAKARFGDLGRKRLQNRSVPDVFLRESDESPYLFR